MPRSARRAQPDAEPDYEARLVKRVLNIHVVQSSTAYAFYVKWHDPATGTPIAAPDPYDVAMPCREWRWRLGTYDKKLKRFYAAARWPTGE